MKHYDQTDAQLKTLIDCKILIDVTNLRLGNRDNLSMLFLTCEEDLKNGVTEDSIGILREHYARDALNLLQDECNWS